MTSETRALSESRSGPWWRWPLRVVVGSAVLAFTLAVLWSLDVIGSAKLRNRLGLDWRNRAFKLERSGALVGLTERELEETLGEPIIRGARSWLYRVRKLWLLDDVGLWIDLDDSRRVQHTRVADMPQEGWALDALRETLAREPGPGAK